MKNVAVIFGSRSAEHDISVVTALNSVVGPLKLSDNYNPIPVYIAKNGNWYSDESLSDIKFFASGDLELKLSKLKPITLGFEGGLQLIHAGFRPKVDSIDVVFPATHGTFGEDGSLMGLIRMANVPYVGFDLQSSVVAMDKALTKTVVEATGLNGTKYESFDSYSYLVDRNNIDKLLVRLSFPLFVKPTHLGSSIAISKVKNKTELNNALELVFHYDKQAIVEEAVPNLAEVTVPVMGNEELTVGLVEEALNKDADFFDFETKYLQGGKAKGAIAESSKGSYSRLPAKLSKDMYKECEDIARAAFRAVSGSGYGRIDLLIDKKTKKIYVNEINPMPGSLYAHNWKKAGISNVSLVNKLLELAFQRYESDSKLNTVFDTNYLKQF